MKQNSPWLTQKQPHVLIFLAFESHQLFLTPILEAFTPGMCLWELWNYDYTGCVCVCNHVLHLSAGQGLFPPHCATGLSMFLGTPDLAHLPKICIFSTKWMPFTWPVDFISTSPFILNQTIPPRLLTSVLVCKQAFGGGNKEKAFIFTLNTMSSSFFVPLFSRLWVCCLILAWGSVGVIGPWLHEGNSTAWVSGWARNSKSENERRIAWKQKQKNKC